MARPNTIKRLERIVSLLPRFGNQDIYDGLIPYSEIADKMGCSIDEAMDTIADLGDCDSRYGEPFYSIDEEMAEAMLEKALESGAKDSIIHTLEQMKACGGILVTGGFGVLSQPFRLTASQSKALISALEFSHVNFHDQETGESNGNSLRDKLLQCVMPHEYSDTRELDAYLEGLNQYEILRELGLLCSQKRTAEITYIAPGKSDEEATKRTIAPLEIHTGPNGEMYLRAYCYERQAIRTFRVDRISGVTALGGHYGRDVLDALESRNDDNPFLDEGMLTATLRLDSAAQVDEREWTGATEIARDAASYTISVPIMSNHDWLVRHIAARFGGMDILSPAELKSEVSACAEEALAEIAELRDEYASGDGRSTE